MSKIIEAKDLPEQEKVYLKKDFMGWRVVEPWKNEDGSINWFNFITGGKKNLIILLAIAIASTLVYLGILELISGYKAVAMNPCGFCKTCLSTIDINLSSIGVP